MAASSIILSESKVPYSEFTLNSHLNHAQGVSWYPAESNMKFW